MLFLGPERKRRRRKKPKFNNPTPQARQVWKAVFPREPWPKGWRVQWAGFMRGAYGLCIYRDKRILLSYADAKRGMLLTTNRGGHEPTGVVATLIHEFTHVRCPGLRHGQDFNRLVNAACARIGLTIVG